MHYLNNYLAVQSRTKVPTMFMRHRLLVLFRTKCSYLQYLSGLELYESAYKIEALGKSSSYLLFPCACKVDIPTICAQSEE